MSEPRTAYRLGVCPHGIYRDTRCFNCEPDPSHPLPSEPDLLSAEEADARALRTVVASIDPSQRIYVSVGTLRWLFAAVRQPMAPDFMAADRALAVAHREDDQPCGCDDCMSYGAEDEGFDWYKVSPARRIVLRVLDSGDDRLAPIATAFREHEEASDDAL